MRVRHPAITLPLILTFSLLAALALLVCSAPQDEPDLPVSTASLPTPHPQAVPSPEPTAASSDILPGGPRINHLPAAMILVSSDTISLDQPLTIAGTGFRPGEPVRLVLVIDDVIRYVVGGHTAEQPVANAAGAFSVSFDSIRGYNVRDYGALARSLGDKTILAQGEDGSTASAPVKIVAWRHPPRPGPGPGSLVATADTVLNDETGGLGITITAAGAWFAPGEAVTVTILSLGDGADKVLTGITANESGAFKVSRTLAGAAPAEGEDPEMPIEPRVYTVLAEGGYGTIATAALMVEQYELPRPE